MTRKAVLRELPVEFIHDSVAGDLGQNAGGGNTKAQTIPTHQSHLLNGQPLGRQSINEGMGWRMSDFLQFI